MLTFLPLAVALMSGPARADPADEARLAQETLPALTARAESARARVEVAERYFAGQAHLAEAWPWLNRAPLLDPAYLRGVQADVLARGRTRAAERVAPAPPGLGPEALDRWRAELAQTLQAEDQADALTLRLVAGLQQGLGSAPGLARAPWEVAEAPLRATLSAAVDPDDEAANEQARLAGEELATRQAWAAAAVRAMTVPGDEALVRLVEADLGDVAALDRLQRVRPLLGPGLGARVDARTQALEVALQQARAAELAARRDELRARLADPPSDPRSLSELEAALPAARDARDAAAAARDALPAEPGNEADKARGAAATAQVEVAEAELDLLQAQIKAARARQDDHAVADQAVQARQRLAQLEADKANEADALRTRLAELQGRLVDVLETEAARQEQTRAELAALGEQLDAVDAASADARIIAPLEAARQPSLDRAYGLARAAVDKARDLVAARRQGLADIRADNKARKADGTTPSELGSGLQAEWAEVLLAYTLALDASETHALSELDRSLELLERAKEARRALRPLASETARDAARSQFFSELASEALEVPTLTAGGARSALGSLARLPSHIADPTAIGRFLRVALGIVVVLFGWAAVRRQGGTWVGEALVSAQEARRKEGGTRARFREAAGPMSGDLSKLSAPLVPLVADLADAVAAGALFAMFHDRLPLPGLFLLGWLAAETIQVVDRALDLALATPADNRPHLRTTSAGDKRLTLTSVRWALTLFCGLALARYAALDLLSADRLLDLVNALAVPLWLGLGAVLLYRWSPVVRAIVARSGRTDRISLFLMGPPTRDGQAAPVSSVLRCGGSLVVLAMRFAAGIGARLVDQRAGLTWIGAALARSRLKERDDIPRPPLDAAVSTAICEAAGDSPVHAEEAEHIAAAFRAWLGTRARGMTAIIGDSGSGKSTLLDRLPAHLATDLPIVRFRVPHGRMEQRTALAWLAEQAGVPPGTLPSEPTTTQTGAALEKLPPSVFIIDDMHHLFLRRVGGFDALRAALNAMHTAAEEHFWVAAFHGPTWALLQGVPKTLSLHVFVDRVRMPALAPVRLAAWLRGATEKAGYRPSFSSLADQSLLETDPDRAAERAAAAYWRLLVDASQGNSEVALEFWLDSLGPGEGGLAVRLFEAPSPDQIESLPDTDLFVLAALTIHNGLGAEDLADVLNASQGRVLAACQHLEGLGVLDREGTATRYCVKPRWRPAVHRLLHRRHFLHGSW